MEPVIRLNLGCGNKILKGWVNVDINAGDVKSDLRDLPFPDEYADEVMSIHVIEHFYEWDSLPLVLEWKRVLKKGCKIIIECPNLEKAVEYMLSGVESPQMTYWPLYGDPNHKDPLMCHKWGYTPKTLSGLLQKAGFREIKREPCVYHLKDIRDMRITGIC